MIKHNSCLIFLILILSSVTSAYTQVQNTPIFQLEEFHPRGGLPNFFRKIKDGKEVRIAYIGGSITEAGNGWREQTFKWLQTKYPSVAFKEINATVGGTGSNLGVFRMDRDVLSGKPDMVFVEFAVNDSGLDTVNIYRSMEGIVRKTWRQFPESDICFVYTVAENVIKTLQSGRYQSSAAAMEKIAEHYQLPSIHMGVEVIRMMEAGDLIFTGVPEEHPGKIVFTKDKTHPLSASGHPVYTKVVVRSFEKMANNMSRTPHKLKSPFIADNWENAQMVPLSKLKTTKWKELPPGDSLVKPFARFMDYLYKAEGPGASFTIKFKGKVLGIYDVIGPNSGIIDVVVDGQPSYELLRFDGWGNNYRKNAIFLKGLKEGDHEVTFTVSNKPVDKEAILAKRKIPFTNPDQYKKQSWLVNNILLAGELKK